MKHLKVLGIVGVLLLITILRYHSVGQPLDIFHGLETIEEVGEFFSFEEPWQDIQYIRYNLTNLTNLWTAKDGETYEIYEFTMTAPTNPVDVIKALNGRTLQYVGKTTKTKAQITSGWDVLNYVGEFFKYVTQSAMYIGKLVIDVFVSIIKAIYGFARIVTGVVYE